MVVIRLVALYLRFEKYRDMRSSGWGGLSLWCLFRFCGAIVWRLIVINKMLIFFMVYGFIGNGCLDLCIVLVSCFSCQSKLIYLMLLFLTFFAKFQWCLFLEQQQHQLLTFSFLRLYPGHLHRDLFLSEYTGRLKKVLFSYVWLKVLNL